MLSATRPADILSDPLRLDNEYRASRYLYHRLLDFEDEHQRILDLTAEECAPGIVRVGRLVARLHRRAKRAARSTGWHPPTHDALRDRLQKRLGELRKQRNADPRWKVATKWADTPGPDAPERGGARRRKGETDAEFAERVATRRNLLTRREQRRHELYEAHVGVNATERSRVYWGTWNGLLRSVDQARAAVLKARKAGLPAEWRRPRWDDDSTLYADRGGFRVIDQGGGAARARNGAKVGNPWWTIELRMADGEWARMRAKLGNWHDLDGAELKTLKLTRRRAGSGWRYSVSIAADGVEKAVTSRFATTGMVGLDWGHREHGHPREREGIRVFTWVGDDGARGEVILPRECREQLDRVHELQSRIDQTWRDRKAAMGLADRSRQGYRRRLMRQGVRSDEEQRWLTWEMRYERRIERARKRVANIRQETYLRAVRDLRERYAVLAIEDEQAWSHKRQAQEDQTARRKRQNRDMSARYMFVSICERYGATLVPVTARNSTRQFACCGALAENTADLLMACPSCGRIVDKDYHAAEEILRRGLEALANHAAE